MYKVQEVAKIAGVSVRTLHHYDSIGLMKPSNIGSNRYRYYNDEDLKLLQHILFFKEIGFSLKKIQELVAEGFDPESALAQHSSFLRQKQERLEKLIQNAEMTLHEYQGTKSITNEQRFNAFANDKGIESIDKYKTAVKQEAPKLAVTAGAAESISEINYADEPFTIEEIVSVEGLSPSEEFTASEAISLPENSTSIEKTETVEETAPTEESVSEDEPILADEPQVEKAAPEKEKEDLEEINREGNRIYTTVASLMHLPADATAVQKEMEAYYILLNRFYNCNPKMFRGLGDLYASDSRFSHNIDQHGSGLAKYLKDAMYIYAEGIENA
ncbi:MerR family transcriptional regulator [Planomicrobium sp. CPCC 101079]|uniref:MerR family transcriptional regulator n=1 Tax=Planomicrobium sp. CPCC 101079 TaxID=2599618 RepID=UPI0011B3D277|nr:MerR family transcriptional regulator [Planomicrobium sp. CPCC 101079]TWT03420.1 MerR family transcriptional regulator [Planomicrobium sp. CPCC 101079]